jgi:hypothetical protein
MSVSLFLSTFFGRLPIGDRCGGPSVAPEIRFGRGGLLARNEDAYSVGRTSSPSRERGGMEEERRERDRERETVLFGRKIRFCNVN